jgi:serine/threonine protein kinase
MQIYQEVRAMTRIYGNRWKTIDNISAGGQGVVLKVEDSTRGLPGVYALKRLIHVDDPSRMKRFSREIETLQKLNHPNTLKIIDHNLDTDKPYFVTEYCAGGSLKDIDLTAIDTAGAVDIMLSIIEGLEEAHKQGVIHRDIKPANILFREKHAPVIADFGICHVGDGYSLTSINEAMGSKNFIAPELESGGSGDITPAADVYSLAKVFYWMVSGGREFSREDHRAHGRYLVTSKDEQRFEHIHMLLDKFVISEIAQRGSLSALRRQLMDLVALIQGDYVPLTSSLRVKCRFCGRGTYQRSGNRPGFGVPEAGLSVTSGQDVVAMWCDVCGHVETFNLRASGYREWFDGKNR